MFVLKFENGEYYAGECKIKGENYIRKVGNIENAKKYNRIYGAINAKKLLKERYNVSAEIAKIEDEKQNVKRIVKIEDEKQNVKRIVKKGKIDPRTETKIVALVDNCTKTETIIKKLNVTKEEIEEVLKANNYVIKENNTLREQMKKQNLEEKHLKIKHGKFHISYVYWKKVLINKVPNGISKEKLLREKGTYTLNMILDVEKRLNEH